ncbi:MAG: DUF4836 family protein [Ferruginibacter sp.]
MQSTFRFSFLAIIAIILFSSCKKNNTLGRYIPENAAMAMHINGKALSEKLPWAEIKQQDYFKLLNADTSLSAFMKTILDNPENTGIDINNDIVIFMVKDSSGGFMALQGTLNDKAKFAAMQSQANPGGTASGKEGLSFYSNARTASAWNDDKFVMLSDVPEMKMPKQFPMMPDSAGPVTDVPEIKTPRDLVTAAKNVLLLKEDMSMAKNEKFSDLVSTKADMHLWLNAEQLNANTPAMGAMAMVNLGKLYEGSIMTAAVNFEAGKILMDVKSYAGKEMTEIWKKYSGSSASMEMIKRIPSQNIAAVFAMNFKPEGIREFLKLAGLDGLINMGSAFMGFNLDDFIKANKGDILLTVGDIKKDSISKIDAQFLFSATIGNKEAFTKLINAGKKLGQEKLTNSGKMPSIFYNLNENLFAIGNNKTAIDQYINKENNSDPAFLKDISGSPLAAYVNFQYIMSSMKNPNTTDSLEAATLDASMKVWDNLIIKGGEMKGSAATQHVEINMVNKTENSLKQLNNYAGVMSNIMNEHKKKKDAFYNNLDTTVVVPVIK